VWVDSGPGRDSLERSFRTTWLSGRKEAIAIEIYTRVARQSVFIVVVVFQAQERRDRNIDAETRSPDAEFRFWDFVISWERPTTELLPSLEVLPFNTLQ